MSEKRQKRLEALAVEGRDGGAAADGAASPSVLEQERARLVVALEAADIGTFALDAATFCGEWDPRAGEILRADAWRGDFLAYVTEQDAAKLRRAFAAVAAPPAPPIRLDLRVRGVRPGETRWCRVAATASVGEAGRPLVVGTLQDVTDVRLTAEQRDRLTSELKRANEQLARSQALLDSLVEYAPVGIAFLDRELRFRMVNLRLAAMNGVPVEDHLGRRLSELFPELPGEAIERAWRDVIRTGDPVTDHEVSGRTPGTQGETRYWAESWYPVVVGDETVGLGAVVRDVTAEKRREEMQELLVGIVGHDLRNPLSAISNGLQVLSMTSLDDRQLRTVDRMRNSVVRMTHLIGDLLDYTRVRAGSGIPVTRIPSRVGDIVTPVIEEAEMANPDRRIVARGDLDETGSWDPDRLRQVLGNLVSNAVKYGARDAPIEVSWEGSEHEVVLRVSNKGPPIPRAFLERVFEPLAQVDPTRRGGVGLGLFITRAVIQAHGGIVNAASDAERGTVFEIRLPRAMGERPHG